MFEIHEACEGGVNERSSRHRTIFKPYKVWFITRHYIKIEKKSMKIEIEANEEP